MSHVIIKKTLAHALMKEAMVDHPGPNQQPVQHFGFGGLVGDVLNPLLGDTGQSTFSADPITTQNFLPQIQTQQQRQTDVYNQQQNLAQALLGQSQGQGPNPALAQLNQQTGNNASMQAALMASQRGASSNPALLARQAAMQGTQAQQMGVGQAATLQAQQQLAAQNALAQQQQALAGNALSAEQLQQTGLSSQNQATNQRSSINAGTSQANAGAQGAIVGGLLNAGGGAAASFLGRAHGGLIEGGDVPGKAEVGGDDEKNDTVPTMLSPGEIVLPRSVTQGPNMEKKAIEFLKHLKKGKGSFEDVTKARKMNCGGKV